MVTDALYHIHVTKKVHTAISYVIFTSACSAEICKDILIHFFNSMSGFLSGKLPDIFSETVSLFTYLGAPLAKPRYISTFPYIICAHADTCVFYMNAILFYQHAPF